ncbi:MAG: hypothetical protein KGI52_16735, partial [Burkholderiales bacterium]|nr:hypothetical protein [Burkholderiales bacterium]
MNQYTYPEQLVQTVVNTLDQCILVLRSLPMVNPVYAQQCAAVIGELKAQADKQDAERAKATET